MMSFACVLPSRQWDSAMVLACMVTSWRRWASNKAGKNLLRWKKKMKRVFAQQSERPQTRQKTARCWKRRRKIGRAWRKRFKRHKE